MRARCTRRSGERNAFFCRRSLVDSSRGTKSGGSSKPQIPMISRKVSRLGSIAPCSQRAMTERLRPLRSASSCWVRPARRRASRISTALHTGTEYRVTDPIKGLDPDPGHSTRNGGERSALLRRSGSGSRPGPAIGLPEAEEAHPALRRLSGSADRAALAALEAALADARASEDDRPPLVVLGVVPRPARGVSGRPFLDCFGRGSRFAAPSSRRLATKARNLAEEPERVGGLPGRDRRPPRLVGGERAERSRRSHDRPLPKRLPAAGPSRAGAPTTGASSSFADSFAGLADVTAFATRSSILSRHRSLGRSATGSPTRSFAASSTPPAVPSATCQASSSATASHCSLS